MPHWAFLISHVHLHKVSKEKKKCAFAQTKVNLVTVPYSPLLPIGETTVLSLSLSFKKNIKKLVIILI